MAAIHSEDELSCPICLELYDYPVTLPCQHNFCVGCLREVVVRVTTNFFSCPQCRRDVQIPSGGVETFPKNYSLDKLVRIVKQHEEQKQSSNEEHPPSSVDQTQDFTDFSMDPSKWEFFPPHFSPKFHHDHVYSWRKHRPPGYSSSPSSPTRNKSKGANRPSSTSTSPRPSSSPPSAMTTPKRPSTS